MPGLTEDIRSRNAGLAPGATPAFRSWANRVQATLEDNDYLDAAEGRPQRPRIRLVQILEIGWGCCGLAGAARGAPARKRRLSRDVTGLSWAISGRAPGFRGLLPNVADLA